MPGKPTTNDRANAGVWKSYCWAHLRRKFVDAGSDAPIAQDALQRIAKIYGIEKDIRGRPPEERLAERQERSRPLIDSLHAWFTAINPCIMAGSATSDAMKYALKRWAGFIRFLDDGRIELDNNSAARAIRPVTLPRKNALFAGDVTPGFPPVRIRAEQLCCA